MNQFVYLLAIIPVAIFFALLVAGLIFGISKWIKICDDWDDSPPIGKVLKVYISGPMTGIKNFNIPEFVKASKMIESAGHIPISPHKAPYHDSWKGYIKYDIKLLIECDQIYMLEGWHNSKGAVLEKTIADSLEIKEFNRVTT